MIYSSAWCCGAFVWNTFTCTVHWTLDRVLLDMEGLPPRTVTSGVLIVHNRNMLCIYVFTLTINTLSSDVDSDLAPPTSHPGAPNLGNGSCKTFLKVVFSGCRV